MGQWMWSVIRIPPCLHGIVDYLGMVFPSLRRSLPVLFVREIWSAWWKSRGGIQWGLSVGLPLPCGGSYFTSSHFLFLFWHCAAELWARDMAAFQWGCATGRQGGRVSSLGPLEGLSCSRSLIQVARLSFYHLLCLSCFLSGIGHFVIGQWLGMTPLSGFCICWKLRFNWFNLI